MLNLVVGQDAQGNTLHGRNLDFGLFTGWDIGNDTWKLPEMLRPVVINVNYTRGGVVQYKTVTFVGFVGVITGLREVGDLICFQCYILNNILRIY